MASYEIYATHYRIEFRTLTRHVLESDFTPKRTLLLACMSMGYELKFSHSGQGGRYWEVIKEDKGISNIKDKGILWLFLSL